MAAAQQDEIERKYDVGRESVFPALDGLESVRSVSQPIVHELEAIYFDTVGLDLARNRITLRRRSGGQDAGWHLKLPRGGDTRTELRKPFHGDDDPIPAELLDQVRVVIRDRELVPVAKISTRRRQYSLQRQGSSVIAEVCDDEVRGERLLAPERIVDWREWEVELADGPVTVLDSVEQPLLEAGAVPAEAASKLARTLGDLAPTPSASRPSGKHLAKGSVGQLFLARVAEQRSQLHRHDAGVRSGKPESVHKLRIAARRLRSALTTYKPILETIHADALRDDLRWLGQALSEARDAQVLREHLDALVASEPAELVIGPVARRIDDSLRTSGRIGLDHGHEVMNDQRYFRLLDTLDSLVDTPPFAPRADLPARKDVPRLLERDAKRMRAAVRAIDAADDAHARDLALHEARKKAKRLRYAAESAVPVFGGRARALARDAKRLQESLGLHQDAVVARTRLREYGIQAHLEGENSFTFGRLHALEQMRGAEAETEFVKAWARLPTKRLRRWLRSS